MGASSVFCKARFQRLRTREEEDEAEGWVLDPERPARAPALQLGALRARHSGPGAPAPLGRGAGQNPEARRHLPATPALPTRGPERKPAPGARPCPALPPAAHGVGPATRPGSPWPSRRPSLTRAVGHLSPQPWPDVTLAPARPPQLLGRPALAPRECPTAQAGPCPDRASTPRACASGGRRRTPGPAPPDPR